MGWGEAHLFSGRSSGVGSIPTRFSGDHQMYRDYEEYLHFYNTVLVPFSEKNGVMVKKKDLQEFLKENYKDRIECYLIDEHDIDAFHDLFFGKGDMESEQMTPEEVRFDNMYITMCDIIDDCREAGLDVPQAAGLIFEYLTVLKIVEKSN